MIEIKIFIVTTIVVCFITKLYSYWKWRTRIDQLTKYFEGPKSLPLIGLVPELFKIGNPFEFFAAYHKKYPKTLKFWLGPVDFFVVSADTKIIQKVLNSNQTLDKAEFYKLLEYHNTILSSPRERWKQHRKIVNPLFLNKNYVKSCHEVVSEKSSKLVENFAKHAGGRGIEVLPQLSAYLIEFAFKFFYDFEYDAFENPEKNEIILKMESLYNVSLKRASSIFYFDIFYRFSKLHQERQENSLKSFYKAMIEKKVGNYIDKSSGGDNNGKFARTFFDPKNGFTLIEIEDSFDGLTFATFETTSTALSCTLLMLAIHQEMQEKLFNEIRELFGENDDVIDYETVKQMKYLDLICKESLRLFPPGLLLGRRAAEDLKIDEERTIPAGTNIVLNIIGMHRNPDYWGEDAHLFIPERFHPDRVTKEQLSAYMPFSAGPRNCSGFLIVDVLLKMALAKVIKNFKLNTDMKFDEVEVEYSVGLRLKNKAMIKFSNRKSNL